MRLIDGIVGFVRRNPVLVFFIVVLAIAAPTAVAGVLRFVMYGILFLLVLGLIAALTIGYRLRRLRDEAERQMGGGNGYYRRYSYRSDRRDGYGRTVREGDVEVQQTQPQEKRVRSDVGDYVDFEDVKDSDKR